MAPVCCGCGSEEVVPTSSIFPLCLDCAPLVEATPITEGGDGARTLATHGQNDPEILDATDVPEPVEIGEQEL